MKVSDTVKAEFWSFAVWGKTLLATGISSGSATTAIVIGTAAAKGVGVKGMPEINFQYLGVMFLAAALPAMLTYLAKSPLPGITIQSNPADSQANPPK